MHAGAGRRLFNERTGTPFNHRQYPTDVVLLMVLWRLRDTLSRPAGAVLIERPGVLMVLWRLRDTLSLRDLAEMFLARGCAFSDEAVRDWEARFAPLLTARLRAKRRGQGGTQWHTDETYSKVNGRWCSLYRAIDREGHLVDARRSPTRDMDAAQRFFRQAHALAGSRPRT